MEVKPGRDDWAGKAMIGSPIIHRIIPRPVATITGTRHGGHEPAAAAAPLGATVHHPAKLERGIPPRPSLPGGEHPTKLGYETRSEPWAAGNVDIGMGCQAIPPHGEENWAEVDLGLRHRRSSDRLVYGQSIPRSEYRNHAAVPQCSGQKAWPTPTRRDGAGQSGLAYREPAQVAKTRNAAILAAVFPETNSC